MSCWILFVGIALGEGLKDMSWCIVASSETFVKKG